jgi:LEA14-like dessication related protein
VEIVITPGSLPRLGRHGRRSRGIDSEIRRSKISAKFAARFLAALALAAVSLAPLGCASMKGSDPLQVTVAGVEPLESQGMELRLLVKLRVQNPNDAPVDYNGVAVEMIVRGKTFATGVSDAAGSVPRFGEALISVPVTASAFRMLGQALGMMQGTGGGPISYELKGKLNGSGFSATHFQTKGELQMPTSAAPGNGS